MDEALSEKQDERWSWQRFRRGYFKPRIGQPVFWAAFIFLAWANIHYAKVPYWCSGLFVLMILVFALFRW